jgi:hypothetical protein
MHLKLEKQKQLNQQKLTNSFVLVFCMSTFYDFHEVNLATTKKRQKEIIKRM